MLTPGPLHSFVRLDLAWHIPTITDNAEHLARGLAFNKTFPATHVLDEVFTEPFRA